MNDIKACQRNLARNLRNVVETSEITQNWIATKLGVTDGYISKVCAGKTLPNIAFLCRIGKLLDVDFRELIGDEL